MDKIKWTSIEILYTVKLPNKWITVVPEVRYNEAKVIYEEITADVFKTVERFQGTDLGGHRFKLLKQDKHKENHI